MGRFEEDEIHDDPGLADAYEVPGRGRRRERRKCGKPRGGRSMGRYPFLVMVNKYLEERKPFIAKSTWTERSRKLKMLARTFTQFKEQGKIASQNPKKLTKRDIGVFIESMKSKRLDEETQRTYLSRLGSVLTWCGNPVIDQLRSEGQLPKVPRKELRSLSEIELEKIIRAAGKIPGWTGEVARFLVRMYPYTGLRPSELRLAEIDDIDISNDNWTIWVRHPKGENSYGTKRTVPILPPAEEAILRFLEKRREYLRAIEKSDARPLIPTMKRGSADFYSVNSFQKIKRRIEELSGIRFKLKDFRTTFAQQIIDQKPSLLSHVSKALGHSSTSTTEKHYARVRDDSMIRDLRNLHKDTGSNNK